MTVIGASAIARWLSLGPECGALIAALERAGSAVTSPTADYEAAPGLRRKRFCSVAEAESDVMEFARSAWGRESLRSTARREITDAAFAGQKIEGAHGGR